MESTSTYWLVWAIISVLFAIAGALVHSIFLMLWNMGWLAYYIYMYNKSTEPKE